jgi:hypothetical protein
MAVSLKGLNQSLGIGPCPMVTAKVGRFDFANAEGSLDGASDAFGILLQIQMIQHHRGSKKDSVGLALS